MSARKKPKHSQDSELQATVDDDMVHDVAVRTTRADDSAVSTTQRQQMNEDAAIAQAVHTLVRELRDCQRDLAHTAAKVDTYADLLWSVAHESNLTRLAMNDRAAMLDVVHAMRPQLLTGSVGAALLALTCLRGDLAAAQLLHTCGAALCVSSLTVSLSSLFAAVTSGRVRAVDWAIANGAIMDERGTDDITPLLVSARDGRLQIVQRLLAAGADASATTDRGDTVRTLSAGHGCIAVLRYLVEHDVGRLDSAGRDANALQAAVLGHRKRTVQCILGLGAFTLEHLTETLRIVIEQDDAALAARLVRLGADFQVIPRGYDESSLGLAIEKDMFDLVTLMLQTGSSVDNNQQVTTSGATVMHAIARTGSVAMLALAQCVFGDNIDLGADATQFRSSPFAIVCVHGHVAAAQFMLTAFADRIDVNAPRVSGSSDDYDNVDSDSALMAAARHGRIEIVKLLLSVGAGVDNADKALYLAARYGHVDVVQYLLDRGINVDQPMAAATALFHAALTERAHVIEYLLVEQHASLSYRDDNGLSALDAASSDIDTVRLLLSSGCDVEPQAMTNALCSAALLGNLEVVKLLVRHGADVNGRLVRSAPLFFDKPEAELTPLMIAAFHGKLDIATFLCENGADVERTTENGWTALHVATMRRSLDVIRYLVTVQGANVNAVDAFGFTVAAIAIRNARELLLTLGATPPTKLLRERGEAQQLGDLDSQRYWIQERCVALRVDLYFNAYELVGTWCTCTECEG